MLGNKGPRLWGRKGLGELPEDHGYRTETIRRAWAVRWGKDKKRRNRERSETEASGEGKQGQILKKNLDERRGKLRRRYRETKK